MGLVRESPSKTHPKGIKGGPRAGLVRESPSKARPKGIKDEPNGLPSSNASPLTHTKGFLL